MSLRIGNLDAADKITFDHGQVNAVVLDGTQFARALFNPGWRWSSDVGPQAGTASCRAGHAGIVLSGRFAVRMDDGTQVELGPGDAHLVAPGHDAWVVGDEQCVLVDIAPAPVAGPTPEDVVREYFAAFNAESLDEILSLFSDDAVVAAEGMPTTSGPAALRGLYEGFFAAFSVTERETVDSSLIGGGVALVQAHSTGTMANKATGDRTDLALREMFGLRPVADRWRICQYLFNYAPASG